MRTTSINRFAFAALLCCGMFLLYSNARAQCPDSTGPSGPDTSAWVYHSSGEGYTSTGCGIIFSYCERVFTGSGGQDTMQEWLDSVTIDSATSCDTSLTDSEIIYLGDSLLFRGAVGPNNYSVWCNDQYHPPVVIEVFSAQCWWKALNGGASADPKHESVLALPKRKITYTPCSGYAYWCEKSCTVCWEFEVEGGDIPIYSNCFTTQSKLTANCTNPPLPPNMWYTNVCTTLGCQATWNPPMIQHANVGLPPNIDKSLEAFPSPTSNRLTITSSRGGAQIVVVDVLGREVMSALIPTGGSLVLDVSSLQPGTYYVSEGQTEVKFVKN